MTIDDALAAGDYRSASLLAAEIEDPRAYLDAMIRVFRAFERTAPPTTTTKGTDDAAIHEAGHEAHEPQCQA